MHFVQARLRPRRSCGQTSIRQMTVDAILRSTYNDATKTLRHPAVNRVARGLDGLEATQSRYLTPIYDYDPMASTPPSVAARTTRPIEPTNPFTSHYAPDCGRPTRGNFAPRGFPTVPVVAWQAGSSSGLLWQPTPPNSAGLLWRARRLVPGIGHPEVCADQVPSTAGHPRRSAREGARNCGKRSMGE